MLNSAKMLMNYALILLKNVSCPKKCLDSNCCLCSLHNVMYFRIGLFIDVREDLARFWWILRNLGGFGKFYIAQLQNSVRKIQYIMH
jgi:hypothetical protein